MAWMESLLLVAGMLVPASVPVETQTADAPAPVRDVVTISVPVERPAEAQGAEEAIAPTAEERRRRARRLARSPLAKDRVFNKDGSVTFVLRNRLHAPVTIDLEPGKTQGARVEMLVKPHLSIGALERMPVARIVATNVLEVGEADFVFTAVVGDPTARHDDSVVYAWPFPAGAAAHLTQGPGGPTHRAAHSRYAIDLGVPEGTPVLAARAGTVIFLENRYFESGLDPLKYGSRANQVRILHDDGSMASYAHLFPDSIELEPGQRVEVGQQLGLSGNTGFSSGPHLHFVVLVHRDMEVVSVPFRMRGID